MAAPKDSFTSFTFVFLGICVLLSWNVILASFDLFDKQVSLYVLFLAKRI